MATEIQHFINGKPTVDVTDDCESKRLTNGVLALQVHAGRYRPATQETGFRRCAYGPAIIHVPADIQTMIGSKPLKASAFRSTLAKRIMAAAARGARDPKRLKLIALGAV